MEHRKIENIGDLAREVGDLLHADRKWLFRGQPDARWCLLPSVHRGYTRQQERYLTNEFRVRARSRYNRCPPDHDYPGWLALMQHYGLPTRLLDWTYSPLVAAFFAVHPDYLPVHTGSRGDACIWALSAGELNVSQGFEPLIFPLDAASYQPLIVPAFKNRDEPETIGVAMAIEHDPRIQLQQGAFTVHSCRIPLDHLAGSEKLLRKFVVPAASVTRLCEELSLLGMRKSNLFPDLAALTSELKAMHRPADPLYAQDSARVVDLGAPLRTHSGKEPRTMPPPSERDTDAGLEDRNLTRAAPTPQPSPSGETEREDQHKGLEDLNLTRPDPPPVKRTGKAG